jgi:hypothetical protein
MHTAAYEGMPTLHKGEDLPEMASLGQFRRTLRRLFYFVSTSGSA